jgi:hypothetical protein
MACIVWVHWHLEWQYHPSPLSIHGQTPWWDITRPWSWSCGCSFHDQGGTIQQSLHPCR